MRLVTDPTSYTHEVPASVRQQSVWNDQYACYQAPDGRFWRYTDDPDCRGTALRDGSGKPLSVSVWLTEDGQDPYAVESAEVGKQVAETFRERLSR